MGWRTRPSSDAGGAPIRSHHAQTAADRQRRRAVLAGPGPARARRRTRARHAATAAGQGVGLLRRRGTAHRPTLADRVPLAAGAEAAAPARPGRPGVPDTALRAQATDGVVAQRLGA